MVERRPSVSAGIRELIERLHRIDNEPVGIGFETWRRTLTVCAVLVCGIGIGWVVYAMTQSLPAAVFAYVVISLPLGSLATTIISRMERKEVLGLIDEWKAAHPNVDFDLLEKIEQERER